MGENISEDVRQRKGDSLLGAERGSRSLEKAEFGAMLSRKYSHIQKGALMGPAQSDLSLEMS